MKKKIIFLDGDGTLWYPKKTKRAEKPHWIYHHEDTKDNYLEHLELTPKIKDTLEILKTKGILMMIISANPHAEDVAISQITERLTHFELNDLFVSVQSSPGDNPKGKADVMLKVLKELNLEKQDALMIGDSYVYDYLAAKEIGIDGFWIENSVSKLPDILPVDLQKISEVSDILNILKFKNTIYLLCGLPGSGKSHWAKENVNVNTIRISHDEEFFRKYGDDWDRKKHDELSDKLKLELMEKIKGLLKQGKNVILDYGFWKQADREEYKNYFKDIADVRLIYFDVPKEVRCQRVLNRDLENNYDLNEEALETFEKKFEVPNNESEEIIS